jgi:hypothetical protein
VRVVTAAADGRTIMSKFAELVSKPSGIIVFGWGLCPAAFIFIALLLLLASGRQSSFDEVKRVSNEAGDIDAVLVETNGGATTSFGYEIFLLPRGEKAERGHEIASLYGAARNEMAYGLNLRWEAQNRLAVEFLESRRVMAPAGPVRVSGQEVTVELKAGVSDPNAPPGGMLQNLQTLR